MPYIDRDKLIADLEREVELADDWKTAHEIANVVKYFPTADVVERRKGKWIEKEVMSIEESKAIDEWQSCRCSVCGRYDTRPYMYYFTEPHFCSWCGAEMRGEDE